MLLYQNRRGYAPIVQCAHCGTVPQCPHCDVSLTFHQGSQQLRCHYCGYSIPMYKTCVACGSIDLKTKGVGTEQISKELSELFPQRSYRSYGSRYHQWQIRLLKKYYQISNSKKPKFCRYSNDYQRLRLYQM